MSKRDLHIHWSHVLDPTPDELMNLPTPQQWRQYRRMMLDHTNRWSRTGAGLYWSIVSERSCDATSAQLGSSPYAIGWAKQSVRGLAHAQIISLSLGVPGTFKTAWLIRHRTRDPTAQPQG